MTRGETESVRSALGIQPGVRVWVGGHNLSAKRLLEPLLVETTRPPTGPVDIAFIAPESADEAAYFLGKIEARLDQTGAVWIILPPNAVANDLSEPAVDASMARQSGEITSTAAEPVALPDGFMAHRFARP